MKIINEKGKLFGIINVVDLMALVAVIAVIGGVAWKIFAPTVTEAVSPQVLMTTTVVVKSTSPELVAELERNSQIGKSLVSGNEYVDAEIISMELSDTIMQATTYEGEIINTPHPINKDVTFVIESYVSKNTPVPKIATQEIRAGRTMIVKTNDFEMNANIISVVIEE